VEIPDNGAEGVIVAQGGRYGGFSLFVKGGRVSYEANAFGNPAGTLVSSEPLSSGKQQIVLDFMPDQVAAPGNALLGGGGGPGVARLSINGKPLGETKIVNMGGSRRETLDIGCDLGTAVSASYAVPFNFTGKIETVRVDVQ
jgi:arylsulfatase